MRVTADAPTRVYGRHMERISRLRGPILVVGAIGIVALILASFTRPGDPPPTAVTPAEPVPAAAPNPSLERDSPPTEPPPTPAGRLNVPTSGWGTDFEIASIDLSEIMSGGPGKDGIPAIDEPRYEPISASREWLHEQAPVIALNVNGEARAYPLAILIWHEITNDTLGGVPLVVTFCPLCNTALVFEREIDGVVYDFGTTGNLRFSDLVMYDRQTESWWQQATGHAIVGTLTGARLPFVASQILSLREFAAAHPEAQVLSRDTGNRRNYGSNPYVGYDSVDQQPFLFRGVVDGRLPPMERVVTVTVDDESAAYPYSEIATTGVVHDEVGGVPVVVFWQPGLSSALDTALMDEGRDIGSTGVFDPTVDGRSLTFRQSDDGSIVDSTTGSRWSIVGHALEGPLAGKRLEPIVHGDHFWFAWAVFEPDTRIWTSTLPSGGITPPPTSNGLALPAQVAGLPVEWREIDVGRFVQARVDDVDATDMRDFLVRAGASSGDVRMLVATVGNQHEGQLSLTAFSAHAIGPPDLAALMRSMGLVTDRSGSLRSELLVFGEAVLLVSSSDAALHAAAVEELGN